MQTRTLFLDGRAQRAWQHAKRRWSTLSIVGITRRMMMPQSRRSDENVAQRQGKARKTILAVQRTVLAERADVAAGMDDEGGASLGVDQPGEPRARVEQVANPPPPLAGPVGGREHLDDCDREGIEAVRRRESFTRVDDVRDERVQVEVGAAQPRADVGERGAHPLRAAADRVAEGYCPGRETPRGSAPRATFLWRHVMSPVSAIDTADTEDLDEPLVDDAVHDLPAAVIVEPHPHTADDDGEFGRVVRPRIDLKEADDAVHVGAVIII
jgi:hypothetical protein